MNYYNVCCKDNISSLYSTSIFIYICTTAKTNNRLNKLKKKKVLLSTCKDLNFEIYYHTIFSCYILYLVKIIVLKPLVQKAIV